MTKNLTLTISISLGILSIIMIREFIKAEQRNYRALMINLSMLFGFITVLWMLSGFPFYRETLHRRGQNDIAWGFYLTLYVSTVLGMISNYFFNRLKEPKNKRMKSQIDIGALLKPVLISPMVLLVVINALQNINADLSDSSLRLSFVLLAYDKGFAWRAVFDKRRKKS